MKSLAKMRPNELVSEIQRLKALCSRAAGALSTVSMSSEEVQELIGELRKGAG